MGNRQAARHTGRLTSLRTGRPRSRLSGGRMGIADLGSSAAASPRCVSRLMTYPLPRGLVASLRGYAHRLIASRPIPMVRHHRVFDAVERHLLSSRTELPPTCVSHALPQRGRASRNLDPWCGWFGNRNGTRWGAPGTFRAPGESPRINGESSSHLKSIYVELSVKP